MSIKPKLTYFDLSMIVVSMIIGIGIFRTPAIIAQKAGSESIFYTAWILGGFISLCGALTFAEIGSRIPSAGGYYKAFSFCYHPSFAFMLIWSYVALNAASAAAVAYTGAQYITPVLGEYIKPLLGSSYNEASMEKVVFIGTILILFLLNYMGIKMGAHAQNVLSSLKILLMLFLISAIMFSHPSANATTEVIKPSPYSSWILALGVSLIPVFFSYGGYQNTSNLGGDIVSPKKNIPRAIVTGTLIVLVLYLTINFVYVKVLGFAHLQQSPLVASDLAKVFFGDFGAKFASIVIFISVLGFINASMLYSPRVLYPMAEEGILPKFFMHVNEKKQTQPYALTFFTLLMIVMFLLLQTYENLLNYIEFNDTISLALAAACIFILRRKQKNSIEENFTLRWYPYVPAIFIIVILGVTVNVVISDPTNSFIGLIIMLLGYPLYLAMKWVTSISSNKISTK